MAHRSDADLIQTTHNTARFFVEHRAISWVLLIAVVGWGIFGYLNMPKRKDPDIPGAAGSRGMPMAGSERREVEQLVTRTIEAAIEQN